MPLVILEGPTMEPGTRLKLVSAIATTVSEILDLPKEQVTTLIHENPPDDALAIRPGSPPVDPNSPWY